MVVITRVRKLVWHVIRACGHAIWLSFETQGYIMAMGYLPADETQELENPEIREYQRNHS
jgi:hypothetical protein